MLRQIQQIIQERGLETLWSEFAGIVLFTFIVVYGVLSIGGAS